MTTDAYNNMNESQKDWQKNQKDIYNMIPFWKDKTKGHGINQG